MKHRWKQPVTLVGAGPFDSKQLAEALKIAPVAVAVDGGADKLRKMGLMPEALVGDFDSLSSPSAWQGHGVRVLETPDQNATDLEKCLAIVRAPLIVGIGFLGGRTDHTLAAFGQLLRRRRLVLLHETDLVFASGKRWQANLPQSARLSVHATRKVKVQFSRGLRWPADGLRLHPGSTRGISNEVVTSPVSLAFSQRGALLITELQNLSAVAESLGNKQS